MIQKKKTIINYNNQNFNKFYNLQRFSFDVNNKKV